MARAVEDAVLAHEIAIANVTVVLVVIAALLLPANAVHIAVQDPKAALFVS